MGTHIIVDAWEAPEQILNDAETILHTLVAGIAAGEATAKPCCTTPQPEQVDQILAAKTTGALRMIDGSSLLGILQLPVYVRQAIETETEIFTMADSSNS